MLSGEQSDAHPSKKPAVPKGRVGETEEGWGVGGVAEEARDVVVGKVRSDGKSVLKTVCLISPDNLCRLIYLRHGSRCRRVPA